MITTGLKFGFVRVPRGINKAGPLGDLYHMQGGFVFRDGVWPLGMVGLDKVPHKDMGFNEHNARMADALTQWRLEALCTPGEESRYAVLEYLQKEIEALRAVLRALPARLPASQDIIRRKLYVLLMNADQYLRTCPSALLVYCTN